MKQIILVTALCCLTSLVNAATFKGYHCTQDCSGHKAGYEWAKKKEIDDKSDCKGNNRSFREGCYAWVDEQERRRREL